MDSMTLRDYECQNCHHEFEADAWHSENGFIGSVRRAQAFVWDKDHGLEVIVNSNVRVVT